MLYTLPTSLRMRACVHGSLIAGAARVCVCACEPGWPAAAAGENEFSLTNIHIYTHIIVKMCLCAHLRCAKDAQFNVERARE